MKKQKLTAEVQVDLESGVVVKSLRLKPITEIDDCEDGKVIILNVRKTEPYTGIFKGMDGDDIMIRGLKSPYMLGINRLTVDEYYEEV